MVFLLSSLNLLRLPYPFFSLDNFLGTEIFFLVRKHCMETFYHRKHSMTHSDVINQVSLISGNRVPRFFVCN